MKNDNKTTDHHGFCENPESKCTLNYCDDNGCTERKRHLVDLVTPTTMSDNTNSAHGFTEGSEFKTETKEMVLKPTDAGYKWFACPTCDGTAKISQDQLDQINKDPLRSELQQLKEYKDVIRELLPIMDAMEDLCDTVGALYIGKYRVADLSDLIIRARKLIDQTDTK